MRNKTQFLLAVCLTVSCKPRVESSSDSKSVVIQGDEVEIFTSTRPEATERGSKEKVSDSKSLDVGSVKESKVKPTNEPINNDNRSHLCHLVCKDEKLGDTKKKSCKTVGVAKVGDLIDLIEKNANDSELHAILLNIIAPGSTTYADTDPTVLRAKNIIKPIFSAPDATANVCEPTVEKNGGLSLRTLYSRNVVVTNKTGRNMQFKAVVEYSFSNWTTYKASPWANWDFAPGESASINYQNSGEIYSVEYKAYVDGVLVQDNGVGVQFDQAGGTYEIVIVGSGGRSNANSGGGSTSLVELCALAMKGVYDQYPKNWFQKGDYSGEVNRCWGAVDQAVAGGAQWSTVMKYYYCEHPGIPVRNCFTPKAGALRKAGLSQSAAYQSAYQYCKNQTSDFSSMTQTMLENFEKIMLEGWTSGDDSACRQRFKVLTGQ